LTIILEQFTDNAHKVETLGAKSINYFYLAAVNDYIEYR